MEGTKNFGPGGSLEASSPHMILHSRLTVQECQSEDEHFKCGELCFFSPLFCRTCLLRGKGHGMLAGFLSLSVSARLRSPLCLQIYMILSLKRHLFIAKGYAKICVLSLTMALDQLSQVWSRVKKSNFGVLRTNKIKGRRG